MVEASSWSCIYAMAYGFVKPLLRNHRPPSQRRPDHARARDLRAARVQRAHRARELGAGADGVSHGLAVDHRGDSQLREALGGAHDVAGFAFRLADPHVLVCAPVALPGRGGVRDDGRDSGGARDVDRDGPVGAVPHRAWLDDAFLGEADAAAFRPKSRSFAEFTLERSKGLRMTA